MRLIIRRDQADIKGLLGGHKGVKFKLSAKASVSGEERELIDRYKVSEYMLATWGDGDRPIAITVNNLIAGWSLEIGSITMLLSLEERVKEGCQNLKTLLEVMASFGGEEVFEY